MREVTSAGNDLLAHLELKDAGVAIRLHFNWDDASGTGLISTGELRDAQTGALQGGWAIEDWQWSDAMDRWVARRWIDRSAPGSVPTQWAADLIEELPAAQIEAYLEPPRKGRPDVLRGMPPLLVDFRSDSRGRAQVLLPGAALPEGRLPIQPRYAVVRWLAAGGAVAVVVLVVLKRKQGARARHRVSHKA